MMLEPLIAVVLAQVVVAALVVMLLAGLLAVVRRAWEGETDD